MSSSSGVQVEALRAAPVGVLPPPSGSGAWDQAFQDQTAVVGALLDAQSATPQRVHAALLEDLFGGRRSAPQALALDVTVPFCISHCLCCERDVQVAQPASAIDDYVDGLVSEMHVLADRVGSAAEVVQLHLGGGTANELGPAQLVRLLDTVAQRWRLPAEAVLSADCDPRRVGWLQLRMLRNLGFRRLSFGLFDLDPAVQAAIGRGHSAALLADVCELARECGIASVDLQLTVGLPRQTLAGWRATLQRTLAMAPDRLTLARFRHRPQQVAAHRAIDHETLPSRGDCLALTELTVQVLCEAGYRWIGADRFVLETDELARADEQGRLGCGLQAYSDLPPMPQLGLGARALGEIDGHVLCNEPGLPAWRAAVKAGRPAVAHALRADALGARRRAAVESLLCRLELPRALAADGLEGAYARLAARARTGDVQVLPDRIVVTGQGRLDLPGLCAAFHAP